MADILSTEKRKKLKSEIKTKNTKPEIIVRKALHRLGFRFRLHRKDLPGKPDIVLPRYKKIIFVNGCFWHQHVGCSASKRPSTNTQFWNEKLDSNIKRDIQNQEELKLMGWDICIIWECETKKEEKMLQKIKKFFNI